MYCHLIKHKLKFIKITCKRIQYSAVIFEWLFYFSGYGPLTTMDIVTHIINSVYVILNICVTGMPTRFLHVHFPVIFGACYSLFSLFYYLAGGTNHTESPYIYPALNWQNPGTASLYCVIVVVVATPVVHFVLFGLHSLKVFIYNKCEWCRSDSDIADLRDVEMKEPGY